MTDYQPVPDVFDVDTFLPVRPVRPGRRRGTERPRLRNWDGSCAELAEFGETHDRMPRFDERLTDGYALGRWMQAVMSQYRPTVEEHEAALPVLRPDASAKERAARARHLSEYADRRARLVAIPRFRFATPDRGPVDWMGVLSTFVREHQRAPIRYETFHGVGLGDYYKRLRAAYRDARRREATNGRRLTEHEWVQVSTDHKVNLNPTVIAFVTSAVALRPATPHLSPPSVQPAIAVRRPRRAR